MKVPLKHLHWWHSCHDLRLPLIPFVSLLRKQQGQAMEVEFHQSDLQDKQSCYQTCRTTVSNSTELTTSSSLRVSLDHQHLFQAPSLFCFYVSSQPTVSLPWRNNRDDQITALKKHSTYLKEKDQRKSCNNERGHMLVWFSLRSPGLGKKKLTLILLPQHVTLFLLTASGNNLLFSILRNQLKFPLSLSPLLCKNICIILDPWVMSLKAICLFLPLSSLWMTEARYHKELCGFPISYQKQQTLEQCVHKGRSDNPPVYCFTCHLQVTHSTHAIHSGQQS